MMSELSKLKKENKKLKSLLKNAVDILDRYRDILQHPEKLGQKAEAESKAKKKIKKKKTKKKPD
jgi:sulfur transfer protein SufE